MILQTPIVSFFKHLEMYPCLKYLFNAGETVPYMESKVIILMTIL